MTRRKKQKRVLIALGWYDYRLHRGIEAYAQEHSWSLSANLAREKVVPWGWEGDGILAWLGAWDELAEFVERQNKPTVDFSFRRPHLRFPRVLEDHAHAARLVADHFLCRGFAHFIFYSDAANWSYDERGSAFVNALSQAGHSCLWLKWHESPDFRTDRDQWRRKRAWLAAELKKQPHPLAVFAANDQLALDVLEACEHAPIPVPDQVAIVGAENYLLAPEAMHIPISSVDTNLEVLGYRGAELLDRLMSGKSAPNDPVRIPAACLVARQSSDLLAVAHAGVARSLRFIWEHSHEPISVKDLVGVAAMSRRSLHTAFLQHLGRTPGQELHRVRIERAKRLLGRRDQKVETISQDCGYQRANSFCVAFKQATGMSPKQYRDQLLP
jgi:LacI family transcriptional regulator, galactose operon repressor